MEEKSPVGHPVFKTGGRRYNVSGEFDPRLFRQFRIGWRHRTKKTMKTSSSVR